MEGIAIGLCVCVSLRNLGECFILIFIEPIPGKNVSPSDKNLWRPVFKKRPSCREIAV